ncbi:MULTISPECIES: hypothetical protein [Rhodococcus]|uniref:hypothetical protein n=1 Tax=Rhodococcus TaxID=1827 RepID=UPI001F1E1C98|nr:MULTISPECIES: hypothetical protein [Rhodococcus]
MKNIFIVLLLAFRFLSAVTCAQPLAAQAPADGSEKFSSLARSRRNFLGPGVALRPPHADAILLCQQAKKFGWEIIGVFVRNCHHAMVDSQLLNCVVEPKACAEELFCGGWVSEKTKCVLLVN